MWIFEVKKTKQEQWSISIFATGPLGLDINLQSTWSQKLHDHIDSEYDMSDIGKRRAKIRPCAFPSVSPKEHLIFTS